MVCLTPPCLPSIDRMRALTAREREILSMVGCAMSDRQIQRALYISRATVRFHLHKITLKLGVRGRVHLSLIAVARGLAPPPASR